MYYNIMYVCTFQLHCACIYIELHAHVCTRTCTKRVHVCMYVCMYVCTYSEEACSSASATLKKQSTFPAWNEE